MTQRRRFTGEFKAQVVIDLISGAQSPAELCRQHQLNPQAQRTSSARSRELSSRAKFLHEPAQRQPQLSPHQEQEQHADGQRQE